MKDIITIKEKRKFWKKAFHVFIKRGVDYTTAAGYADAALKKFLERFEV